MKEKKREKSKSISKKLAMLGFVAGFGLAVSGCAGMVPKNFIVDTSTTNPQPLLGVDIQFDPQINVTNTNDNASSADTTLTNTSSPTVTNTTSDSVTNTSNSGK